jgi:hypothetical protein
MKMDATCLQGGVLMMEAARVSETSVNFQQTTRRYNPEESDIHIIIFKLRISENRSKDFQ